MQRCRYSTKLALAVGDVGDEFWVGLKMTNGKKKQYERPELTKVSLRPEEAVLGACKISGGRGAIGNDCNATQCRTLGS